MSVRPARPDAGFSILLVVATILLLLVLGLATATLVAQDSETAAVQVQGTQAFYAAHAGIEYAIVKLGQDPRWKGLPQPGKAVGSGSFWVDPPAKAGAREGTAPGERVRVVARGQVGRVTRAIEVEVAPGTITTLAAGSFPAEPWSPAGIAVHGTGDLLVADPEAHVVRRIDLLTGRVTVVAGTGADGSNGDGERAETARLREPVDICVSSAGDLYIADVSAHVVRMVSGATGTIATVAGTGRAGSSGDGGSALTARLHAPSALALGSEGDLYIAERSGHRIRRVDLASGVITTAAGSGAPGYAGDNGVATSARLLAPEGVAVAPNGDLYIADTGNRAIRRVARATGIITTIAGSGLATPRSIEIAPSGDLYIADGLRHQVLRWEIGAGSVSAVAGTGAAGFAGDGEASLSARLHSPFGIAVSRAGTYYIADRGNHRVRKVTGLLSVVAWNEAGE